MPFTAGPGDRQIAELVHKLGELYPYHYEAAAANRNITTGFTATLFKPYDNITRAQVITMVVRAVDVLHPGALDAPGAGFTSSWGNSSAEHGANAAKAEANGLLEGLTPPGASLSSFSPFGDMSREEVAQVLHNVLDLIDDTAGPPVEPPATPPPTTPPQTTPSPVTPPPPPVTPPEPPVLPPEPPLPGL